LNEWDDLSDVACRRAFTELLPLRWQAHPGDWQKLRAIRALWFAKSLELGNENLAMRQTEWILRDVFDGNLPSGYSKKAEQYIHADHVPPEYYTFSYLPLVKKKFKRLCYFKTLAVIAKITNYPTAVPIFELLINNVLEATHTHELVGKPFNEYFAKCVAALELQQYYNPTGMPEEVRLGAALRGYP
jgi:hypothetical protein